MTDFIDLYNSNSGIKEKYEVKSISGDIKNESNSIKKYLTKEYKKRIQESTKLDLLEELIDNSIKKGYSIEIENKILELSESIGNNNKYNFLVGNFYMKIKKDFHNGILFYKKSLDSSEIYKEDVFNYIDFLVLDYISLGKMDNKDINDIFIKYIDFFVLYVNFKINENSSQNNEIYINFKKFLEKLVHSEKNYEPKK